MSGINVGRRELVNALGATSVLGLAACGGGQPTAPGSIPRPSGPVSIVMTLTPDRVAPGQTAQAAAALLDADGRVSDAQRVDWASSNPAVATVTAQGLVAAVAPGQAQISASSGALSASRPLTVLAVANPGGTTLLDRMYEELPYFITTAISNMESAAPANPHLTTFIHAQLNLLRAPRLAEEIVARGQALTRMLPSMGGQLPAALIYLTPDMQARAERMLNLLAALLPLAEAFFDQPFPPRRLKVWYGFAIGSDSSIAIEDEAIYAVRPPAGKIPYDNIAAHELAHGYMPHEALNQFLELLFINQLATGDTSLERWTNTRGYVANQPENQRVHALLDMYGLIGLDAMRIAYRRIQPQRPPYGQLLSPAVLQVFVDVAPASAKDRVHELASRIGQ